MPTLDWIGKNKVVNHHMEVPYHVLKRKYSFDEDGQHEEDNGSENGLQCFKFAAISFWPFGRRIEYGGGAVSFLVNVVWFLLNGWWMALGNSLIGCLWCITIVGVPFGKQFFKIAKLSLRPFGAYIAKV